MSNPNIDILSFMDRAERSTPDVLLAEVLPQIVAAIPSVTAATVQRLTRGGVAQWASTESNDDASAFTALADLPQVQTVLDSKQAVQNDQQTVLPLLVNAEIFALLVLQHQSPPDLASLNDLSKQLAFILHHSQLQQLLQQQVIATSKLSHAETLADVVRILAEHSVKTGQFVTINTFDYDGDDQLIGATAVVSANRGNVFSANDKVDIGLDYLQLVRATLLEDGDFLISNVYADERLSDTGREWLKVRNIVSTYNLPLKIQERLYGFISIIDTRHSLAISAIERQTFINIAEQASVAVEKRRLLDQAESALHDTQTLYALTTDITQAQDLPDILRVLHNHLGEGARTVSISEYEYDTDGDLQDIYIKYVISKGDVQEVRMPWFPELKPEFVEAAATFTNDIGDNLEVIPDYGAIVQQYPAFKALQDQGIGSSITIPLFADGHRVRQITFAWSEPNGYASSLPQMMEAARIQISVVLKNLSLLATSQESLQSSSQRAQTLRTLNDFIISTNREEDEQELLDNTAELLCTITGVDHTSVGLLLGDNQTHIVAEYPLGRFKGLVIEEHQSVTKYLLESPEPIQVPNIATSEFMDADFRKATVEGGTAAMFVVGMFDLQGQLFGSVSFDYQEPVTEFDPSVIEMATTVVSQVAVNIQKLRLLNTSQQQATQMRQVTEFSQRIMASLQSQEIIQTALHATRDIFNADYVSLLLYDRQMDTLRQAGEYWEEQTNISLPGILIPENTNSIAQNVWKNRELYVVDTLQSNWDLRHPYSAQLQSLLVNPMVSGGVSLGVMEIGNKQINAFDQSIIAAFQQVSNQIAVALSNADTYAQSQKLARNKVLANEIIAQLQRQTDMDTILSVTAVELGKALGAKRARIRLGIDIPSPSGADER